jgi:peroxin-1
MALIYVCFFICRVYIDCSKLAIENNKKQLQAIAEYIYEAIVHSPSIIVFDDLHSLISFSPDNQKSQSSNSGAIAKYLVDVIDEYRVSLHLKFYTPIISFVARNINQFKGNLNYHWMHECLSFYS